MAKRGRPPRSKLLPTDPETLLRIVGRRSWHWTAEFTRCAAGQPPRGSPTAEDVRARVFQALLDGRPADDALGDEWRITVKVGTHPKIDYEIMECIDCGVFRVGGNPCLRCGSLPKTEEIAPKVRTHPGKTIRQHIKEAMTEVRRNETNATEDSVAADEGIDPRSVRRRRKELRKRIPD